MRAAAHEPTWKTSLGPATLVPARLVSACPPGEFPVNGELVSCRPAKRSSATRRQFLKNVAAGLGASVLLGQPVRRLLAASQSSLADLPTALVYDDICKCHAPSANRYECPGRYTAVMDALSKNSHFSELKRLDARPATDDEIRLCHRESYVELAEREIESGADKLSTGDTCVCHDSLTAARYAGGGACVGVDAVLGGEAKNAFCLVRPPGHHAGPDRGMGFCIFNNVGIAARYAQQKYGVGKVLIVDWDVHHGNGTQDIFYDDASVFYFSTHQRPWYPGTGAKDETGCGRGLGTTMNWPMKAGAGRADFLSAFYALAAEMDRFKPELVLISAGFDARHGDPKGKLELTDADYVDLTSLVLEMAQQHSEGRVVSVLEGGYSLPGLASAAAAHCGRLQQGSRLTRIAMR
jgi:acetoin utilization deacetylase AcuC-like enzyme